MKQIKALLNSYKVGNLKREVKHFFIGKSKMKLIRDIRFDFETFFEGQKDYDICDDSDNGYIINPIVNIPISNFGITSIKIKENKNKVILKITLSRPGLFIGKKGNLINQLIEYLSKSIDKKVEIELIEFKSIWEDWNLL